MDPRSKVYIASNDILEYEAAHAVYKQVIRLEQIKSIGSEQSMGREEIKRKVQNRLSTSYVFPILVFENGLIYTNGNPREATYCVLRTHLGLFRNWIYHDIKTPMFQAYLEQQPQSLTFGEFAFADYETDWYVQDSGDKSRVQLLAESIEQLQKQYEDKMKNMYINIMPEDLNKDDRPTFNLENALKQYPNELAKLIYKLSNDLVFNAVIYINPNGRLLADEFIQRKVPVIMARKLIDQELIIDHDKEYGTSQVCIEKSELLTNAKILVIDDIIGIGQHLRMIEQIVKLNNSEVVAFIVPSVCRNSDETLMCQELAPKIKFVSEQDQVFIIQEPRITMV